MIDLDWMAWTVPTAIFFATIVAILIGMTLWQFAQPSIERRGLLPIRTTRGDRLFISLLTAAYIHLAWIALVGSGLWWALAISLVFMIVMMRWG